MTERLDLLGVGVDPLTMDEALDRIFATIDGGGRMHVAFVNAACLNEAARDEAYRRILEAAELVLPDGTGVRWAGRSLHGVELENVNGTDLFPLLCERAAREGRRLFLLGGRDGVAAAAGRSMEARVSGLVIAGTHHGYVGLEEDAEVLAAIRRARPDVLLVGMGVPRQEKWIAARREALDVPVVMGVGGLFDFYSGRIPRAPRLVRRLGHEWAWRLAQEPRRLWRRYLLGNPLFLWRLWRAGRGPKE